MKASVHIDSAEYHDGHRQGDLASTHSDWDEVGGTARSQPPCTIHSVSEKDFVGQDVYYRLATGENRKRIYLDSAASTLQLKVVRDTLRQFQPFYANTHSSSHFGARLSTNEYNWAHRMVLEFVQADPILYASFFLGNGTTACMNRIARTFSGKRPDRDLVITTIMEHHSNDLPHRQHFRQVLHVPVKMCNNVLGCVDLERLENLLAQHAETINYVAVIGVSNVTGIVNPIHEVAVLAHRYKALVVVDAAQMIAHMPIQMSGHTDPARNIDVLVFSGHKTYAPGSPGVVVARRDLFANIAPVELGGGMVEDVYINRYIPATTLPEREEAGTPNIGGAISLGAALYYLQKIGMHHVAQNEKKLGRYALDCLKRIRDITIYGDIDHDRCDRIGVVSFNINGIAHALTAMILNDYFGVAVRNGCFCAHPYVRELITDKLSDQSTTLSDEELEILTTMQQGMVRVSFGLYNNEKDVNILCSALQRIVSNKQAYTDQYELLPSGEYKHKVFNFNSTEYFSAKHHVDAWLARGSLEEDDITKEKTIECLIRL